MDGGEKFNVLQSGCVRFCEYHIYIVRVIIFGVACRVWWMVTVHSWKVV